jgi:uncharacterized coiled-coil DUF342 family protein
MNQLELNTIESFRLAKRDIISLQSKVIQLSLLQEELIKRISSLSEKETSLYQRFKDMSYTAKKPIVRAVTKVNKVTIVRAKKHYVASKASKKFHLNNCPFALNIKPKSKVKFASKTRALNLGLKPCKCV